MDTSPTSTSPGYGLSNLGATSQAQLNKASAPVSTPQSTASRSSTTKAGARQITRNRASYSCHTCRRRKVKCDKVHPVCGNCVKNGTECIYDAAPQKDTGSRHGQTAGGHGIKRRRESSRPLDEDLDDIGSLYGHLRQAGSPEQKYGSQAIEARLDKLTSMIERLSKSNGPLDAEQRLLLAQNVNLEAGKGEARPGNGAPVKTAGASRPDSPRRTDSSDEFPIPAGLATDLVDPVGSLNLGHLSLEDGGRSRYVGTTYWAYISHEINELNQLLKYQSRSHQDTTANESSADENMTDTMAKTTGSPWKASIDSPGGVSRDRVSGVEEFQKSVLFPTGDSPSVKEKHVEPEMLDHVPTKRQSHILYKGFMSGIHAISPVIHPPTILKLYNSFWDWYDYSSYSGDPCPDPSFIPLLYAIWYGGSVTISIRTIKAEFNVSSRSALSKTYNEEVTRWLTKISFPRSPSLQGLAAYLLVQTILSKEEEPLTSSLFISLAMRVAQTMGLHRDPAKFGIKPYEAEYRRRIWWHIVHMDGVVAMSSGLPPLVSDENFWDVRDASEVKDTLLGTPEAEKYEELVASGMRSPDNPDDPTLCGGPSMVNVYYLSARGKYVMARAVRRILKIQLGTKPVTRRDMEELRSILLDLQLKLNSIIDRIPEIANYQLSSSANNRSLSFSVSPVEMRTSDLELPGEGPGRCTEQYHSPVLVSFHKWARILLSLFIDKAFCVAYQPFLKNAKSRIWPAARHRYDQMTLFGNSAPEAPKSRAFIDKIFSLTGPDGGVVGGEDGISAQRPLKDGGREAWDMIRRLRQKAWQKAGLDPHKLWTEQAQIQAGAASGPDEYPCASNPYYANSGSTAPTPSISTMTSRQQLADFSKMFYNMTRSHMLPNPVSTIRPSPLRYQLPQTSVPDTPPNLPTPQMPQSPAAKANAPVETPPPASTISSPDRIIPPLSTAIPFTSTPPPPLSFMDLASPSAQSLAAGPTPPSLMDPNLNFDWDQWDAVFGQHLPVADELMELDPVAGFEFGDLGGGRVGGGSRTASLGGSETGLGSIPGPDWVGYC
ncbi:C6 transcription factor [Aspergillus bombycis]|uniref:C6 transcription factor n=1 Tax=Aspergillus bombycis TaxID=109264 RepID=A0A1F8AC41_9EURO|nr:C6 transcription factor [Aspergillus bombycis]OGM49263.1 C6 transcription factor [Aspergillus bombycis]